MEVEFPSRNIPLWIKVESLVPWFRRIQNSRIDWIMEEESVFVDKGISDIHLAEKHFCIALTLLHHSEKATGDTQLFVILASKKVIRHSVRPLFLTCQAVSILLRSSQAATTERFNYCT